MAQSVADYPMMAASTSSRDGWIQVRAARSSALWGGSIDEAFRSLARRLIRRESSRVSGWIKARDSSRLYAQKLLSPRHGGSGNPESRSGEVVVIGLPFRLFKVLVFWKCFWYAGRLGAYRRSSCAPQGIPSAAGMGCLTAKRPRGSR